MTNYRVDCRWSRVLLVMMFALATAPLAIAQQRKAQPPKSVRLYVFDCGTLNIPDTSAYQLKKEELATKLAKTGAILLSGDLYHYPEERTLNRVPTTEFNVGQTIASRAAVEAFLKKTGAQLWIQHDFMANAKLKRAPEFYE